MTNSHTHRALALTAVVAIGTTGMALSANTATAAPMPAASTAPADQMPAFYTPPATLPAGDGTVIRSEPMKFYSDPLHLTQLPGTATRMMYTSRDRTGHPVAVTGSVIVPNKAWTGSGERPVIGFAVGTQGLADRCAPSYSGANGFEYEVVSMTNLLNQGYALAVTDYQGLGTPGPEMYQDRQAEGQDVIDSVRAAQHLTGSGVPADGPVAFVGYSQGGGSSASAAELAGTYAPELKVKGSFAGAAPADRLALAKNLDGGLYSMFAGYVFTGMADGFGIDTAPYLNTEGKAYIAKLRNTCTIDLPLNAFRPFTSLTSDGSSLPELLGKEPFKSAVADNRVGNRKPSAPVYVYNSLLDDIVPYKISKTLAQDWCGKGANVQLKLGIAPTHVGGYLEANPYINSFLKGIFAGKTPQSGCGSI